MPIRLTSPRRPNTSKYAPLAAQGQRQSLHDLSARSSAAYTLLATAVALAISILLCRHAFWSSPSFFLDRERAFQLHYSEHRLTEARDFITFANNTDYGQPPTHRPDSANQPILCAAMASVKRDKTQYLNDTIGTMLAGLTPEERSALNVRLLFADLNPSKHPNYNDTWLNELDWWGTYNLSESDMTQLRDFKSHARIAAKGIYDYTYLLESCLNSTTAPYIAVIEDDLVFADGWLAKTLNTLRTLHQTTTTPYLYLRLFFTEFQLGWDKGVDPWYTNPIFRYVMALTACALFALALKLRCHYAKHSINHSTCPPLLILTLLTLPAFLTLLYLIGPYALNPHQGLFRMDTKGCCTQALIYPRHQIPPLISRLRKLDIKGQTDVVIEKYADELGLARWALAPQVVQHIGLISTRGMPKKYTQQTWAFHFEEQDARRLGVEHREAVRWGDWRGDDEGEGEEEFVGG